MAESDKKEEYTKIYARMILGAIAGFSVTFLLLWGYLSFSGKLQHAWNPYAGPPPVMTCSIFGLFGSVVGALVGLACGSRALRKR